MLVKLAIFILRKSKSSVIINCDIGNQTVIAKNKQLYIYDNNVGNAKVMLTDGSYLKYGMEEETK